MNRTAFRGGRRAAAEPAWLADIISTRAAAAEATPETLDEVIARRVASLTAYQDEAYARRYADRVARVAEAARRIGGDDELVDIVARQLYRLMAIKDEYEVARLYTDGHFARRLAETFEGTPRLAFHLAPPLLARPDPVTGRVRKMTFGPWMWPVLRMLAKGRTLRGTWLDVFGRTSERRAENALLTAYENALDEIVISLTNDTRGTARAIARLPENVTGFGHVRAPKMAEMHRHLSDLLKKHRNGAPTHAVAAE